VTLLRATVLLALATASVSGCTPSRGQGVEADSSTLAAREARLNQALAGPDSGASREEPVARWVLPLGLAEISGMALTPDQRLLAHNDERGAVTEIDYRRGRVVKQFLLGKKKPVHADFEGITIVGDRIFMLASNGDLYEFKEGGAGARVDYTLHDTHLGKECEFEGVAYDPAIGSLLMACKHVLIKGLKDHVVIYRWRLEEAGGDRISTISVPLAQAVAANGWKEFNPSDITVDPTSGNYVIIASLQKGMLVLSPAGAVLQSRSIPGTHDMAEGVAITKDSILIVSDESTRKPAVVTLYRWP
jgi:uncharacterized protein YjiK